MPNLDNIHFKFFPKSRTSPLGKKLIYGAWCIEIVVALVSLSIAYTFNFTNALGVSGGDALIISLALVVVAVMELTKIPLVTALYYSGKWGPRLIFILLLIFANYSTLETMIQAFDVSVYNQLKKVDIERQKLVNSQRKIDLLRSKIDLEQKKKNLNSFAQERNKSLTAKRDLENKLSNEITSIYKEYNSDNTILETLEKNKVQRIEEKSRLEQLKSKAEQSISQITGNIFFSSAGANRKALLAQIEGYNKNIQILNSEIKSIENQIQKSQTQTASKAAPIIESLKNKYKKQIEPVDNQIDQINNSIKSITAEISNISNISEDVNNQILKEKERYRAQEEIVEEKSKGSNILRISLRIKNRPEWIGGAGGAYTLAQLTQDDLDEAFFYWFGLLAFVISIIGSGVAYAGLHLGDERMHEYRNKPGYGLGGIYHRISRILITVRKYFLTKLKLLFKPKIIEKEIEVEKIVEKIVEKPVEVIKVVDKIIEKPVVEEKIVYQKIEVPKEIIKKVYVHVPFPTDDPGILKKGPIVHNDDEKDKK